MVTPRPAANLLAVTVAAAKSTYVVDCLRCGKRAEMARANARFCSTPCKQAYHNKIIRQRPGAEAWMVRLASYGARPETRATNSRARNANLRAFKWGAAERINGRDVRATLAVGACFYCGSTTDLEIDHRVPLSAGGPNTRANLVAACGPCNARKAQGPVPDRWSENYDACQSCDSTDRRHAAAGLCMGCYDRRRRHS